MKQLVIFLFVIFYLPGFAQIENRNSNRKFSIGINFSPDYTYRRLYSSSDDYGMIPMQNDIEFARFGFTTGLVSCYQLNNRFALESGIQFADKGEKYEMSNGWVTPDGTPPENDPFIPETFRTKYHYYYLGIPVKFNYYVLQKGFKLFISAGASTDFYVAGKEKSVYEFKDKTEKRTVTIGEDFNKVNFTGLAGFGVDTNISNRLQFRFEPILRYSFTPLVDAFIKDYLFSIGANFSIFLH